MLAESVWKFQWRLISVKKHTVVGVVIVIIIAVVAIVISVPVVAITCGEHRKRSETKT
jgi:hypothetical protein